MTATSLERIRRSYSQINRQAGGFSPLVYDHLFGACPQTRALFLIDMDVQQQHFASALSLLVGNLDMLDAMEQPLRELGASHARAGVRAEHYAVFQDAVIGALAETLGKSWTDELCADWRGFLEVVAGYMLAGAGDLAV